MADPGRIPCEPMCDRCTAACAIPVYIRGIGSSKSARTSGSHAGTVTPLILWKFDVRGNILQAEKPLGWEATRLRRYRFEGWTPVPPDAVE